MAKTRPTYKQLQARLAEAEQLIEALRRALSDAVATPRPDAERNAVRGHGVSVDVHSRELSEPKEPLIPGRDTVNLPLDDIAETDTAAETAADAIIGVDPSGMIRLVNTAAEKMFGYSRQEMLGQHIALLIVAEDRPQRDERGPGQPPAAGPGTIGLEGERSARRKDGMVFSVHLTTGGFLQDDLSFSVLVVQDITVRKRTQREPERLLLELRRKNDELEQFAFTISHDLRSPLITIRGFVGLLVNDIRSGDKDRCLHDLARIRDAALKMETLLEALLRLSRLGHVSDPRDRVSITSLAREAADLVASRKGSRKIVVEVADDLPEILCDRTRIFEVLLNLIDNAAKFMGDQPAPRIEIGGRSESGGMTYFVADNGVGIEPRHHQRVFELFRRMDSQTEGTGIGLAISKRIIESHGGKIWIESQGRNSGCTVCFTIPSFEADR